MKMHILLFSVSTSLLAQNLSPDEQKKLTEENKFLKAELQKKQATPQDSSKLMETLKKGQNYQVEQAKALEELDKEE